MKQIISKILAVLAVPSLFIAIAGSTLAFSAIPVSAQAPGSATTNDTTTTPTEPPLTDQEVSQTISDECKKPENKTSVFCDAFKKDTASPFSKAGLPILIVIGLFGLVSFVFTIAMLIHALTHPLKNKLLWAAIIFFGGLLGAIVYFFVGRKQLATPVVAAMPPAPAPMPVSTNIPQQAPVANPSLTPPPAPSVISPQIPQNPVAPNQQPPTQV